MNRDYIYDLYHTMSGEAEPHHVEFRQGVNALLESSTLATNKQHWVCCKCNNLDVRGNGDRKCFRAGCVHNRCDDCQSWDDTPASLNSTLARESTERVFDYDFMRPQENDDLQTRWPRPFTTTTPASPFRTPQSLPGPKSWLPPVPPLPPRRGVKDVADESNKVPSTSRKSPSAQPSSRFVRAIANAPLSSDETYASLFLSRPRLPRRPISPPPPSFDAWAAQAKTTARYKSPVAAGSAGTDVTMGGSGGIRRRPFAHTRDEEAVFHSSGSSSGQPPDQECPLPASPSRDNGRDESTPSPRTLQRGSNPDNDPSPPASSTSTHTPRRSSLWLIWAAIVCISVALLSLVILSFATANAMTIEKAPSSCPIAKPKAGDPEFLYAVQNCGWQVSNILAGLIPACIHAHRYHKWFRMCYVWIPATICLALVVVSVPLYVHSPAISAGMAGVSNMPLGFFIFFAAYETLREDIRRCAREEHVTTNGVAMQPMANGRVSQPH